MARFIKADALRGSVAAGEFIEVGKSRRKYNGGRMPDDRCARPWYAAGKAIGWLIREYDANTGEVITTFYEKVKQCIRY